MQSAITLARLDGWMVKTLSGVALAWMVDSQKVAPGKVSYPGNLTSNSEDLQSSPVSTPELCSNKSLCQESDIPLIH